MALPQALDALFETTKDAPSEMTVPIDVILATDILGAGGGGRSSRLHPALVAEDGAPARRNPPRAATTATTTPTITKEDVAAVLAAPTGFQPWELAQLEAIQGFFRERAGTKLAAKARVAAPRSLLTTFPHSSRGARPRSASRRRSNTRRAGA